MIIQLPQCGFDFEEFHFNFTYSVAWHFDWRRNNEQKGKPKLIIKTHLISIKNDLYTQSQRPMRRESDAFITISMRCVLCMHLCMSVYSMSVYVHPKHSIALCPCFLVQFPLHETWYFELSPSAALFVCNRILLWKNPKNCPSIKFRIALPIDPRLVGLLSICSWINAVNAMWWIICSKLLLSHRLFVFTHGCHVHIT